MIHTLFPNKVYLDEVEHRYYDNLGNEYMSFSKLFKYTQKPFDADGISKFVAKANGTSQEAVLQEWKGKTENGTRIDNALELYAKTGQILDTDADIADLVKDVLKEYSKYHKCFEQVIVYSEEYKTAGAIDKLFLFSNRKDSNFGISDFKAFEDVYDKKTGKLKHTGEESLFVARGWMEPPFDYLPNTKYVKISFQLSYYATLFEELTGRKCKDLFIHLINPIDKTHKKIPVFYLKREVEYMLECNRDKIIKELTIEEEGF